MRLLYVPAGAGYAALSANGHQLVASAAGNKVSDTISTGP
jgi:hypothetical protein